MAGSARPTSPTRGSARCSSETPRPTATRAGCAATGDVPVGIPASGPVLEVLAATLEQLRTPAIPGLPPLTGGMVGYLSYDLVRRFEAEAKLTAGLQHPGVVPVYEIGRLPDQRPFFTMKLVQGKSFDKWLLQYKPGETGRIEGGIEIHDADDTPPSGGREVRRLGTAE